MDVVDTHPTIMRSFASAPQWAVRVLLLLRMFDVSQAASSPWSSSAHAEASNLVSPLSWTVLPRPSTGRRRQLQSADQICSTLLDLLFANDALSQAACACQHNSARPDNYALVCNYADTCGSFCADPNLAATDDSNNQFDCFDRTDTYHILLTLEFFVNTRYEGCGTYHTSTISTTTPSHTLCTVETRSLQGQLESRCLAIDDQLCECRPSDACEDYVFRCQSPDSSNWQSFVLDECSENAYGSIAPGTIESLLSSDIFSLTECFDDWTAPPTTPPTVAPTLVPATMTPTAVPVSTCVGFGCGYILTRAPAAYIVDRDEDPTHATAPPLCQGFGCGTGLTRTPVAPPTQSPTALPSTLAPTTSPTDAPSYIPSTVPTDAPSLGPSRVPSLAPTSVPTANPPATTAVALVPFQLWLTNSEAWTPADMLPAVEQVLAQLLQPTLVTLTDIQLTGFWMDGDLFARHADSVRLECVGKASFVSNVVPDTSTLTNAQFGVLGMETDALSQLLTTALGDVPVTVQEVRIPQQISQGPREGAQAASASSAVPLSLATGLLLGALAALVMSLSFS